jgi:hypothetical protein
MQDRPTAAQLLDAVRGFLEADIIPALQGRKQFHARVAANVLAIVERELALERKHLEAEWGRLDALLGPAEMPERIDALHVALLARTEVLCEQIRSGDADTPERHRAVLDHVRETVREKLAIAKPELLATGSDGR